MLEQLKLYLLKKFYRLLIVKIDLVDKTKIARYDHYKTFSTLNIGSNKGLFTFVFKEDRRHTHDAIGADFIGLSSYFVELIPPEGVIDENDTFKDKIAVVVKLRISQINYKALASLLLDLYIDCFTIAH